MFLALIVYFSVLQNPRLNYASCYGCHMSKCIDLLSPPLTAHISVPGPVQNLQVLNKTNSTVTVGWTPLDDVIQYYFVGIFSY